MHKVVSLKPYFGLSIAFAQYSHRGVSAKGKYSNTIASQQTFLGFKLIVNIPITVICRKSVSET